MKAPKLWTGSFVAACIGNFLLFLSFYLLLPILPAYLIDTLRASKSYAGIIIASYTLASLCVRPFSGYLLDRFSRRPFYLLAYLAFVFVFVGYAETVLISIFILMRVLHGMSFGLVTTAGSTVVVDIMPSERRGEGLGYFGISNNLSMSIGPLISLFLIDHKYSFSQIVYISMAIGVVGFIFATMVKIPKKEIPDDIEERPLHSYDRFFLVKGFRASICLLLLAVPYGMMTSYIALYGKELGIHTGMGLFFLLMAVGLIISRFFSGKLVDKGFIPQIITTGNIIGGVCFVIMALLAQLEHYSPNLTAFLFFSISIFLGVGYGMLFPAFNTLFVNLAPNRLRATASSTYLTSWDLGIGVGLILGGIFADITGTFSFAFFVGAAASVIAIILFRKVAAPHFMANKLR